MHCWNLWGEYRRCFVRSLCRLPSWKVLHRRWRVYLSPLCSRNIWNKNQKRGRSIMHSVRYRKVQRYIRGVHCIDVY